MGALRSDCLDLNQPTLSLTSSVILGSYFIFLCLSIYLKVMRIERGHKCKGSTIGVNFIYCLYIIL